MTLADLGMSLLKTVAPVLGSVLLGALTLLALKIKALIAAKEKNEWVFGALNRLDDHILTAVKELEQTVVDDLTADGGQLTAADKLKLKTDALAKVKSYYGPEGLAEVADILGLDQIEALINGKIEATVHDVGLKQQVVSNGAVLASNSNAAPPVP